MNQFWLDLLIYYLSQQYLCDTFLNKHNEWNGASGSEKNIWQEKLPISKCNYLSKEN